MSKEIKCGCCGKKTSSWMILHLLDSIRARLCYSCSSRDDVDKILTLKNKQRVNKCK
ncbi:MAG: hypothetical protein LBC64_01790 [Fibromonadaceae bacterium]|jgi:hypothetical protein|nr:hypothetical protein [Fibromonadaceae bacterium]